MAAQTATVDLEMDALWTDGAAITSNRLNEMARVMARSVFEYMGRGQIINPGADARSSLLVPLRDALRVSPQVGMNVIVSGGTFLWFLGTGVADGESQVLVSRFGSTQTFVVDAAPGSGTRWDVISAKLERVNGAAEDLDFQDSNGNYSTQSQNTRRLGRLTLTYTPGSDGAEPALPSGHTKVVRIEVPTATVTITADDHIKDYRFPGGFTNHYCAAAWWDEGIWIPTGGGRWTTSGTTAGNLLIPLTPPCMPSGEAGLGTPSMRLQRIRLAYNLAASCTIELVRRYTNPASFATIVEQIADISADFDLDATNNYTSYDVDADLPIWETGRHHAASDPQFGQLCLRVFRDTSDSGTIYSCVTEWWGGA